jgi:hypothetical protein
MTAFSTAEDCALLRATLENHGVEIRIEKCDGDGGLVRLGDRHALFVPSSCSETSRIALYLESIKKIAGPHAHLPPRVRQLLGEEDWNG